MLTVKFLFLSKLTFLLEYLACLMNETSPRIAFCIIYDDRYALSYPIYIISTEVVDYWQTKHVLSGSKFMALFWCVQLVSAMRLTEFRIYLGDFTSLLPANSWNIVPEYPVHPLETKVRFIISLKWSFMPVFLGLYGRYCGRLLMLMRSAYLASLP